MRRFALFSLCLALFAVVPSAYAATPTRTITLRSSNPAAIPRVWSDPANGNRYELTSIRDLSGNPGTQTQAFEAQSTRIKVPSSEVTPTPTAALNARFPVVAGVDEGAFVGRIPLQEIETFPITETLKRQVERVVEIEASTNDIEDLPTEMLFDTSSGEQSLKRAKVSFDVIARDDTKTQRGDDGMPASYKVTMTFRGVEEYEDITHYEALAHYKGAVMSTPPAGGLVEAIYSREEAETTQTAGPIIGAAKPVGPAKTIPAPDSAPSAAPSASSFPLPAVIAATATALVVACFGATRNARVAAQGYSGLRTLGYTRVKRTAGGYECAVPSWINLPKRIYQEERAVVIPRKRLRDKEGVLTVTWRNTVLFRGDLSRRISLAVPSESALSPARRELRGRLVAVASGGAALAVLAIITVSVVNTMIKV